MVHLVSISFLVIYVLWFGVWLMFKEYGLMFYGALVNF